MQKIILKPNNEVTIQKISDRLNQEDLNHSIFSFLQDSNMEFIKQKKQGTVEKFLQQETNKFETERDDKLSQIQDQYYNEKKSQIRKLQKKRFNKIKQIQSRNNEEINKDFVYLNQSFIRNNKSILLEDQIIMDNNSFKEQIQKIQKQIQQESYIEQIKQQEKKDIFDFKTNLNNNPIIDWSKQKNERIISSLETNNTSEYIGPGYYLLPSQETNKYKNQYQYNFISKNQRIFDQIPGEIQNKFIQRKFEQELKLHKINDFTQPQEYILNASPGPGYYQPQQNFEQTQSKNKQFLVGICSQRFQEQKSTIGPGAYNVIQKSNVKNQASFKSQEAKFEKFRPQNTPGPGNYNPDQKNYQSKGVQYFGSLVEKNYQQLNKNPGPGAYITPDIIGLNAFKDVILQKRGFYFNSIKKQILKQNTDYIQINQEQSFEIPNKKQIPFYSKQKRFYQINPIYEEQHRPINKNGLQKILNMNQVNLTEIPFNTKVQNINLVSKIQ